MEFNLPREWFERRLPLESDGEIGVGIPAFDPSSCDYWDSDEALDTIRIVMKYNLNIVWSDDACCNAFDKNGNIVKSKTVSEAVKMWFDHFGDAADDDRERAEAEQKHFGRVQADIDKIFSDRAAELGISVSELSNRISNKLIKCCKAPQPVKKKSWWGIFG